MIIDVLRAGCLAAMVSLLGCGGDLPATGDGGSSGRCERWVARAPRTISGLGAAAPVDPELVASSTEGTVSLIWQEDSVVRGARLDAWGPWTDAPLGQAEDVLEAAGAMTGVGPDSRVGVLAWLGAGSLRLSELAEGDDPPSSFPVALEAKDRPRRLGPREPDGARLLVYWSDASASTHVGWLRNGALHDDFGAIACGGPAMLARGRDGYLLAMGTQRALGSCATGANDRAIELGVIRADGGYAISHLVLPPAELGTPLLEVDLLALAPRRDGFIFAWRFMQCYYGFAECSPLSTWLQVFDHDGKPRAEPKAIDADVLMAAGVGELLAIVTGGGDAYELQVLDDDARIVGSASLAVPIGYSAALVGSPDGGSVLVASLVDDEHGVQRVDCSRR